MQPGNATTFSSVELRWFFDGDEGDRADLRRWFETYEPFAVADRTGPLAWTSRKDGKPDTYLLLPGYENMGIKWREGTLQIKGLVADDGPVVLAGRHEGYVQRWIKWTFGDVPAAMRGLFRGAHGDDRLLISVAKTRALRLVDIDKDGGLREVAAGRRLQQGVAFEMAELQVGADRFVTIAFEAFPDAETVRQRFEAVVGGFVSGLDSPGLSLARSMSYPMWLNARSAV